MKKTWIMEHYLKKKILDIPNYKTTLVIPFHFNLKETTLSTVCLFF